MIREKRNNLDGQISILLKIDYSNVFKDRLHILQFFKILIANLNYYKSYYTKFILNILSTEAFNSLFAVLV